MKFREGFVSNSSASSFCLFGWQVSKLTEAQLESLHEGPYFREGLGTACPPDEGEILGVGNSYYEIDHDCNEEDWHDFESPPPSKEAQQQLLILAQELDLPRPSMFSGTYWE